MTEEPAMQELARDDSSRKRFLKMMGAGGGAAAFSIFLAACGEEEKPKQSSSKSASGPGSKKQDLEIVQYALTLEYLETDFYDAVIKAGVIKDKALAEAATMIRDNEQAHVDALPPPSRTSAASPSAPRPPSTR